ncbi:hypothetical protein Dda_8644 [Drechslerella dactyloides]|uniref:Zn(2)-C6 fungal-type domain-containing protein n=1 Tax=Drechslerella dactyloides TaxID=74499 RepID=A0AAD6NG14_DREDA|nr:hypothetical protein Dda_8644 [Drechslerella dactyloides]
MTCLAAWLLNGSRKGLAAHPDPPDSPSLPPIHGFDLRKEGEYPADRVTRHVRTRTGCWTCRFRKKKCDEARPACEQCSHLRLICDGYDAQPIWMKDQAKATEKKKEIKTQMVRRSRRRKKSQLTSNKAEIPSQKPKSPPKTSPTQPTGGNSSQDGAFGSAKHLPALPIPMSVDDHDFTGRFQTSSPEDSGSSELSSFNMTRMHWAVNLPSSHPTSHASPRTNCTLTSKESTRATSVEDTIKEEDEYDDQEMDVPDSADSSTDTELVPYAAQIPIISTFRFNDLQIQTDKKLDINLASLYLRSIFGVTYRALSDEQVFRYNDALILPMFKDNKSFLHGCLSSTALHLTATNISETQRKGLVTEVYRHRQKSLKSLKAQVANSANDEERIKIAATVCALISFDVFSRRTDWRVHVKAATDCIVLLNWCQRRPTHPGQWFIYSRVLWLDILSSLTTGEKPVFSDFYRSILFLPPEARSSVNGLGQMMGCEDSVLYLISEITCLEHWKFENLSSKPWLEVHEELVRRAIALDKELKRLTITDLSNQKSHRRSEYGCWSYNSVDASPQDDNDMDSVGTDFGDDTDLDSDFGEDGDDDDISYVDEDPPEEIDEVVDEIVRRNSNFAGPERLYRQSPKPAPTQHETDGTEVFAAESTNKLIEDRGTFKKAVTEAFRIMARVYLRVVTYGFNSYDADSQALLQELLAVIDFIPNLYMGFERSIISPLLIVGSLAINPGHQQILSTRLKKTPHMAKYGNLGNVDKILTEIWSRPWAPDPRQPVPWRQVMVEKGWEYLMV